MVKERKVRMKLETESRRNYPACEALSAEKLDSSFSQTESTFLELVVRGRDNRIYEDAFLTGGGVWEVWGSLSGATSTADDLYCN